MKPEESSNSQKTSFLKGISEFTKRTFAQVAQVLGLSETSEETVTQPVERQCPMTEETKTAPIVQENVQEKKMESVSMSKPKETTSVPIEPKEKLAPMPVEQTTLETESLTSSVPTPSALEPEAIEEPTVVWSGEEGPALPTHYGETVLQAMARDPHWAYLYWEIAESTREKICAEEGEWIFDTAAAVIRVQDESGNIAQEIPILLDTHCWYIPLPSSETFVFELGLKKSDGSFCSLVRSNKVTLPPAEPSKVRDEKWAAISEEFEEILQHAGGLDYDGATPAGSSAGIGPHVLRHRLRMDWIPFNEIPSSVTMLPSSHVFPSSHTRP